MILNLRQPANDSNQDIVRLQSELFAEFMPAALPLSKWFSVEAQRNNGKLFSSTNSKLLVNLFALLFADNDYPISSYSRERLLNHEEEVRLRPAVVTVKDVAMIGVNETAPPRPSE